MSAPAALVLPVVGSVWRDRRYGTLYVVDGIVGIYEDFSAPKLARRRSYISFYGQAEGPPATLACSLEEWRAAMDPTPASDVRPADLAPGGPQ